MEYLLIYTDPRMRSSVIAVPPNAHPHVEVYIASMVGSSIRRRLGGEVDKFEVKIFSVDPGIMLSEGAEKTTGYKDYAWITKHDRIPIFKISYTITPI
jgi:hypothetical protein